MRTFTNPLSGSGPIATGLSAQIVAFDASCTYAHGLDTIAAISPLQWEIPYGGGMAKLQDYTLSLVGSDVDWALRLPKYLKATCHLQVTVGSNQFNPHAGVVRGFQRPDRSRVDLFITDRLQDQNPLLPRVAVVDSWSTPHPAHLGDGYPLYYGLHVRPFFHTAVVSNGTILIGPRNVSSANHVTSTFFNPNLNLGADPEVNQNLALTGAPDGAGYINSAGWYQQSGSTNAIAPYSGLINPTLTLIEVGSFIGRVVRIGNNIPSYGQNVAGISPYSYAVSSACVVSLQQFGYISCLPEVYQNANSGGGLGNAMANFEAFQLPYIKKMYWQTFAGVVTGASSCAAYPAKFSLKLHGVGGTNVFGNVFTVFSYTLVGSNIINQWVSYAQPDKMTLEMAINGSLSNITLSVSYGFGGLMDMAAYKRYSIFSPITTSSDLAVSNNPFAIMDHVFSLETFTPFLQSASSLAQIQCKSYQFNGMYLGPERQPLTQWLDEVGKITATNLWQGDSGMMHYRVYQNSATCTNCGNVNKIITPLDVGQRSGFKVTYAPVGSTLYESIQASYIILQAGYDFQTGLYSDVYYAVNCLTNVNRTANFQTKLIAHDGTITASLYLSNLSRIQQQQQEIVEFELGPAHLDLEVGDVLNVQNPMIVGSQSLYQIKHLQLDLQVPRVSVLAAKLSLT